MLIHSDRDPVHLCVGLFDGVHLGHQALLKSARREKEGQGGRLMVLTFHPHPTCVIKGGIYRKPLLFPARVREAQLYSYGVDRVLWQRFDCTFACMPADSFMGWLLDRCPQLKTLHVGADFRFGQDRKGDLDLLKSHGQGVGVKVVGVDLAHAHGGISGQEVSSSLVRAYVREGRLDHVQALLGRPYASYGQSTQGRKSSIEWARWVPDSGEQPLDLSALACGLCSLNELEDPQKNLTKWGLHLDGNFQFSDEKAVQDSFFSPSHQSELPVGTLEWGYSPECAPLWGAYELSWPKHLYDNPVLLSYLRMLLPKNDFVCKLPSSFDSKGQALSQKSQSISPDCLPFWKASYGPCLTRGCPTSGSINHQGPIQVPEDKEQGNPSEGFSAVGAFAEKLSQQKPLITEGNPPGAFNHSQMSQISKPGNPSEGFSAVGTFTEKLFRKKPLIMEGNSPGVLRIEGFSKIKALVFCQILSYPGAYLNWRI